MVGSAPNDRLRLSVYASKGELSFNIPQMLHDSHSHYLKLCERAFRSRLTLRKEGQVELLGETPKRLSAA